MAPVAILLWATASGSSIAFGGMLSALYGPSSALAQPVKRRLMDRHGQIAVRVDASGPVPRRPAREGPASSQQPQSPCWPRALRAIRSWLIPAISLLRWWRAWTDKDPPAELQALIDAVTTGQGIDFYRRV